MTARIDDWEASQIMNDLKSKRDIEGMAKLFDLIENQKQKEAQIYAQPPAAPYVHPADQIKLNLENDLHTQNKTVTMDVRKVIEHLLGGRNDNRDVQVRLEKYGHGYGKPMEEDELAFIAVNICDLKTRNIITLRETYGKFPSSEFLAKLNLLKIGEAV